MKSPHYKEKWFQALALLCLFMSISIGLDPGLDLDTPRNDEEQIASNIKSSVGWIVGLAFMLFFYISYGIVSILHWVYFQVMDKSN